MIRINLLGETVDRSGIYFLQLLVFGCCAILSLGACYIMHQEVLNTLSLKSKEADLLQKRLTKLKKITKEVEGLEEKKKLLKEKLLVIAKLKANKHGPVRVLDELNLAMPERLWLEKAVERGGLLELKGIALDNPTISLLMYKLENSDYFRNVDLVESKLFIKDDVKLSQFSVTAQLVSPLELRKEKGNTEDSSESAVKGA